MSNAGEVRGVVIDGEGRPVALATIVVVNGTVPVPEIALVADGAGRFRLRLPQGRYTLEAMGESGATGRGTIEVSGPSHEMRIEVT